MLFYSIKGVMYSYDRRKVARRTVGGEIETIQESVKAAQEGLPLLTQYVAEVKAINQFMGTKLPLDGAEDTASGMEAMAKNMEPLLQAVDQLDDAIDGYARHVRKGLPYGHEDLTIKDLDKAIVTNLKQRARQLVTAFGKIRKLTENVAGLDLDIDNSIESKRIDALNKLSTKISELAGNIDFSSPEIDGFLSDIEEPLLTRVNDA